MTERKPPLEKKAQDIIAERKVKQKDGTQKKSDAPQAVKKTAGANWPLRILLCLITLLIGAGGALYFLPQLQDRIPALAKWAGTSAPDNSPLIQKLAALESRLDAQENEIQALKIAPKVNMQPDPAILDRLNSLEQARLQTDKVEQDMSQSARIDMLLSRMGQLEASFVPLSKGLIQAQEARIERSQLANSLTAHNEKLAQLDSRLGKVEGFAARDTSGALLAFRIGELRRKVTAGADFGPEIDALKAMMAEGSLAMNDQIQGTIEWLDQHRDGVITAGRLRDRFDDLIPDMIRARSNGTDDPWWKRAYDSSKNLIMVRKTKDIEDTLDAAIAGARQMLDRFDLKAALDQLKQISGEAGETLNAWIMQAEIYLRAEEELDQLESLTTAYYLDDTKAEETGS
ncbi:MAG: hypothetical protein COA81_02020 [Alphaproteobacteria bacterium]|nr:MAG: hypothetical protein COA81_02020 [Alphaproteobacteria bacterium]